MTESHKVMDASGASEVPTSTGVRQKLIGYLSALCVSLSAALAIVAGQLLGDSIDPFQTNFARFILQTCLAIVGLIATRTNPKMPLKWKPALVMTLSVIFNLGAGVLFIVSAWYLPAALVQGLLESCIMTLSAIYAIFGKKCTVDLPFAILLCYIGCILMIQPPGMFNTEANTDINNCSIESTFNCSNAFSNCSLEICQSPNRLDTVWGVLAVFGVGVCLWCHAQFNVGILSEWVSIVSIMFWLGLGCVILSVPILGIIQEPFVWPSAGQVGLELLFGLAFSANIFCIMYAVTILPMSHVAVVLPTGLVFLYIFQKTILREYQPGPDNWIAIFGLVLTLLGALLSPTCDILREKRRTKTLSNDEEKLIQEKRQFNENTSLIQTK